MQGGVAALLYNGSAAGIFFGRAAWRADSDTRVCRQSYGIRFYFGSTGHYDCLPRGKSTALQQGMSALP